MPAKFDMQALRNRLGLTQADMAARMGLSPRAYFQLEQTPRSVRDRHVALANMASLDVAIEQGDATLLTAEMETKIGMVARGVASSRSKKSPLKKDYDQRATKVMLELHQRALELTYPGREDPDKSLTMSALALQLEGIIRQD